MLNILAEREFPADEVFAVASRRSMGVEVSYGDKGRAPTSSSSISAASISR